MVLSQIYKKNFKFIKLKKKKIFYCGRIKKENWIKWVKTMKKTKNLFCWVSKLLKILTFAHEEKRFWDNVLNFFNFCWVNKFFVCFFFLYISENSELVENEEEKQETLPVSKITVKKEPEDLNVFAEILRKIFRVQILIFNLLRFHLF